MKKILLRSKKKRIAVANFEDKKVILKSISNNTNLIKITRWNSGISMSNYNYGFTQLTKRCVLTNRKNILNKNYNISRLAFLKCARQGLISGLIKSTW